MKEILIYSGIYDWTAEGFIKELNAAKGEDLTIRMNTNGGDPVSSYGMIAKLQEYKGKIKVKVDGKAYSTGAYMLLYASEAEGLDVSEFLFHRAAYPSWIESNKNYFTEDMKKTLNTINANFRKAMEAKLDIPKLEQITGVTLDKMMSLDDRINVTLNAQQAKEVGLIDTITTITPSIKAEIESLYMGVAAKYSGFEFSNPAKAQSPTPQETTNKKPVTMDINKLRAEHPELFAQVKALGASEEKDRVEAWMEFKDIDAKAVAEGIQSGKGLSQKDLANFTVKAISAKQIEKIEAENPNPVVTAGEGAPKTEAEKKILAFEDEADKILGIKKEGGK
jgi:ATP-dependent protease ClpP protease subunit